MRTIIAGSRSISDPEILLHAIEDMEWEITLVLCGEARGVDLMGKLWAQLEDIPYECYPPDWERHGKKAGLKRNIEMARNAEALLAIWDGKSSGTAHMIKEAKNRGLFVHVIDINYLTYC